MTPYYKDQLESGLEFQDHVMRLFSERLKIPLSFYSSRKCQLQGESMQGIEVKYDKKFRQTGNLYIEVAEKSSSSVAEYTPSGIMKKDNSWLYAIGDHETLYIFAVKHLRTFARKCHQVETPTSRGFLLPLDLAEKLAATILREENNETVVNKS